MSKKTKQSEANMRYRASFVLVDQSGRPSTLNEENRSVDCVIATETPVRCYSWRHGGEVDEVLLMDDVVIPRNGQVPLLDSHSRYQTYSVLGSTRNIKVEGATVTGTDYFSSVEDARDPWTKTVEGHLTDRSAGYSYNKDDTLLIPAEETAVVNGRSFTAGKIPLLLVKRWYLKENSICPIGADAGAKARMEQTDSNPATPTAEPTTMEKTTMDEKLRKFLERRGLSVDATEAEAYKFMETLDVREETPDVDAERAAAAKIENARVTEITAMCENFNIDEKIRAEMVGDTGFSVDKAREKILKTIANKEDGTRARVEMGEESVDKFKPAAVDGLAMRMGMDVKDPAPGADDLRGFTLSEMARECLRISNKNHRGDAMTVAGRAFTSSDFPIILSNVANKSLADGYDSIEENWEQFCGVGSVGDFKEYTKVRASEMGTLEKIGEDDEYKFDTRSEKQEKYSIATYGKMFRLSRKTIIDDDLAALKDTPFQFGEGTKRLLGDLVYAVLMNNPTMSDGTALFHADHGNLAGSGAIISVDTLDAAVLAMKRQKDIGGLRKLNIQPTFLLGPAGVEAAAEEFFANKNWDDTDTATTRINRFFGRYNRIFDPRLDGVNDDQTAWYMLGPKGKTITLYFLNGVRKPYLESREGWNVDGTEWKCRIDAGAAANDWKAMYKNAGA